MAWNKRDAGPPRADWVPIVDKDLFYRTMDIFNGAFKRKVRLEVGDHNKTDHKTIWVNFKEKKPEKMVAYQHFQEDEQKHVVLLACGHTYASKKQYTVGDEINCGRCGGAQAYLGFEHEWEHIYFKSNLVLRKLFVDEYVKILTQQIPVDPRILSDFLHMLVNAFDDIRVNSLQERVYPGSAERIWERWKRLVASTEGLSTNLICFIFAVALGVPTDPAGPFEPLRQVMEYATQKVRYKGPGTMYTIIRWAVDRSMGAILAHIPPLPQQVQGHSPPAQGSDDDDQTKGLDTPRGTSPVSPIPEEQNEPDSSSANSGQHSSSGSTSASVNQGTGGDPSDLPPPTHIPSGAALSSHDPQAAAHVLGRMALGAKPVDESEDHPMPTPEDIEEFKKDPHSRTMLAALGKALQGDPDTSLLDQMPASQVDPDMAHQLQQLQQVQHIGRDQQITSYAKAKMQLIDVKAEGMTSEPVALTETERNSIERMRAAFFRVMGRLKAQRASSGSTLDVQALIQYLASVGEEGDDLAGSANDEVFEQDQNNQGFCYLVLSDMSGSMRGPFKQVCHATEMLKKALKFPFVEGDLWGFRGAEDLQGKESDAGEVWIYRYDRMCQSYTGTAQGGTKWEPIVFPVNCGGLTPMNSAVHVAVRHLLTKPTGMAKNLFILTDGNPMQFKADRTKSGYLQVIPEFLLRQFVRKEVNWARQKGIGVYTLLIGHGVSDEDALQMFGPRKFWKRVGHGDGQESLERVLPTLITENFVRHMKR